MKKILEIIGFVSFVNVQGRFEKPIIPLIWNGCLLYSNSPVVGMWMVRNLLEYEASNAQP